MHVKSKNVRYPNQSAKSGKWLIFVSIADIDAVWKKIKLATENGLLGDSSKASTARINPNATKIDMRVICVYSYDHGDRGDVMRIRNELRKIGVVNKISYKTDDATRRGLYEKNGNIRISLYYE